jgi:hypothetical protein
MLIQWSNAIGKIDSSKFQMGAVTSETEGSFFKQWLGMNFVPRYRQVSAQLPKFKLLN